ncbi:MAG: cellulose biosynthesis cyclic di-GMP-binding regulatory protein BcsB [Caldilineaceae bacterium]
MFCNRRTPKVLSGILLFLLPVVFAILTTASASAQEQKSGALQFTFEHMGFAEDRVAAGTVPTLIYDLPVPRSWTNVQPTFYLHFSHSNLLLPDLSQMTIFYNDVPIADARLTAENETSGWLNIVVPPNALRQNSNRLKIAFYQRLTDDRCGDSGTEAGLWSVIHKDSVVDFQVDQTKTLDLSWFPEPFSIYGHHALAPVALTMVLPANANAAELQAAGLVTAKLGKLIGSEMLNLAVSLGKLPSNGQIIMVGQNRSISKLLDAQTDLPLPPTTTGFTGSVPVQEKEGVVQLGQRADGSALLVVSGSSDDGLLAAAQALADGDSLRLMSGNYTIVKASPQPIRVPSLMQPLSTLEELTGSGNQRVEGTNVEELNYCFRMPPNWTVDAKAMLDLHHDFSPNLWTERSSLVVKLNGTTVASTKLSSETPEGTHLQIPLPSDQFVDGYNCIHFLYTLRMEQSQCAAEMGGELWAEIDAQSTIFLPRAAEGDTDWQPNMNQYPYPYNIDQSLADTTIVLPVQPTTQEIASALKIASKLGSEVHEDNLQLTLKSAAAWDQNTDQTHNLILFGEPARNSVAATLQAQQLALTDDNELTLQIRQDIFAHQQSGTKMAVAELSRSPWLEDKAILQIVSNSDLALDNLIETLTRNPNKVSLEGNITTVTDGGITRSVDTLKRKTKLAELSVTGEGVTATEPESISTIRWFVLGGIGMLSCIAVLLVALTIRERRNQKIATQLGEGPK